MSRYQYEVIDNLDSNRTDAALSANQGRILKEKKQTKDCIGDGLEIGPNNKLNMKVASNYTFSNGKLVYQSSDSLETGTAGIPFSAKAGNQLKEKFKTSYVGYVGDRFHDAVDSGAFSVGDFIYYGQGTSSERNTSNREELLGALLLIKRIETSGSHKIYHCRLMNTPFLTPWHSSREPVNYGIAVPGDGVKFYVNGSNVTFEGLQYIPYEGATPETHTYNSYFSYTSYRPENVYLIKNYGGYYE